MSDKKQNNKNQQNAQNKSKNSKQQNNQKQQTAQKSRKLNKPFYYKKKKGALSKSTAPAKSKPEKSPSPRSLSRLLFSADLMKLAKT